MNSRTSRAALREAVESGALKAWMRDEKIQFTAEGKTQWLDWSDPEGGNIPSFGNEELYWRVAPEKKRVLFTLETVPKGAIRRARISPASISVITGYGVKGVTFGPPAAPSEHSYEGLSSWSSYSLDGGITWCPAYQEIEP